MFEKEKREEREILTPGASGYLGTRSPCAPPQAAQVILVSFFP